MSPTSDDCGRGHSWSLLSLSRERSEMARLSDWIDGRVDALCLGGRLAYAVRLCLEEAVLNIVTHGERPNGAPNTIEVSLDRREDGLRACIEDHGTPFDPLGVAQPAAATSLETARVGGLGIMLMRRFAREVTYDRRDGVNRLVLRFAD